MIMKFSESNHTKPHYTLIGHIICHQTLGHMILKSQLLYSAKEVCKLPNNGFINSHKLQEQT